MAAPLVAIVGQTASGKSDLAITLAKQFNGEIICADSRTVYKGMDICTAKPSKSERREVKHHLLDVVNVEQAFNVAKFKSLANISIKDIQKKYKLPILVGGSGLFVDAVLYNYSFSVPNAERDKTNPRHLNASVKTNKRQLLPNTLVIGIKLPKTELNERIEARANLMLNQGLINEVKNLSGKYGWDLPAFQEPAFKAFRSYLEGNQTLEEAKKVFVTLHRHYAKRQMTWFKRNPDINWVSTNSEAAEFVSKLMNK